LEPLAIKPGYVFCKHRHATSRLFRRTECDKLRTAIFFSLQPSYNGEE